MNLVCLDTHYFKWAILMKCTPSQEEMIPQSAEFFKWLDDTNATIIVPTPIVTELMMGASAEEKVKIISKLEKGFRVVEYDMISAKYAAEIWNVKTAQGVIEELKKSGVSMRTKLKVDVQILGIAISAGATVLYTQDEKFAKLADGYLLTRPMPGVSQGNFLSTLYAPQIPTPAIAIIPALPPAAPSNDEPPKETPVVLSSNNETKKETDEKEG